MNSNYLIQSTNCDGADKTRDYAERALALYSDMLYRLAFSHMRTVHDSQDVFQEVFLRLISKPREFNDDEHLKAWLIRATINCCKSVKTSAWFRKTTSFDDSLADTLVFAEKEENDLFEYLSLLSGKFRTVIHLFYCEEMTVSEIAAVLKAKESTVRTWLTRARAVLRKKLERNNLKGDYFNE
jgi:RNA polymerase sigma-70 factor (ECF subfamily)